MSVDTSNRYEWLPDELHVFHTRGWIKDPRGCFDAWGRVCPVTDGNGHRFVIKSVVKGSPEITNMKTLLALPSARNHTIPAQVIDCEKTSLIVMPWLSSVKFLWWMNLDLGTLYMLFGQILEAVEFMHEKNIAFIDTSPMNIVSTKEPVTAGQFVVPVRRVYFIDFGSSRQLASGPGSGVTIQDYAKSGGHFAPPEGDKSLDPYAYDVFAVGSTLNELCQDATLMNTTRIPSSVRAFIGVLTSRTPSRRLSMRQAKQLWAALSGWLSVLDGIGIDDDAAIDVVDKKAWTVLSKRVLA